MRDHTVFYLFLLPLLIFGLVYGCVAPQRSMTPSAPIPVTILFFNDLHGHLTPFKVKTKEGITEVGGIARVATIVKQIEAENDEKQIKTIVLVAGDILQGTPMSTVFKGEPDIIALNAIGVDAMTVGNHEFDFGLENFLKLKNAAVFPFLSANISWRDTGASLCRPGVAFEVSEGFFLNVLGVTTQQLMTTTLPSNVEKLSIKDPVDSLRSVVDVARKRGAVLVLSHSRHRTDRRIAENYSPLVAIIGGHDQILMTPYRRVAGVPIFQAFEKGRYVGRIDLAMDPATHESKILDWAYLPVTSDIVPDARVSGLVAEYERQLNHKFKAIIGWAEVFLEAERGRIRYEETNLGNWVTDIMRAHTGADIALLNSGSLRASIAEGPVSIEDVFRAMPYANTLVTVKLSGRELLAVLTRSVMGAREDEDGGFLQVSGLRFTIRGRVVQDVRIGMEKTLLDPDKVYTVATTNFIADGGDGYHWIKAKAAEQTQLPLRELLINTIIEEKMIFAKTEGRILRLSP